MSEQINEFDQIVRERLGDQTAPPPPVVWENIQSKRSFGHMVANKISMNWGMFGTLLMLLLAGGSAVYLFGEEENSSSQMIQASAQEASYLWEENSDKILIDFLKQNKSHQNGKYHLKPLEFGSTNNYFEKENLSTAQVEITPNKIPDLELIASLYQTAFVKPKMQNKRLSAYIDGLKGWEDAKPKSFVRYYQMDAINQRGVDKAILNHEPLLAVQQEYDYAMPNVKRKTFKERSSLLLNITPQIVSKIMSAEYNLSSSYLELRDKTAKTRFAYTFGAMLHYEIKNNKFIETGINFSQIYEEMHYEGEKRFSNQYNFLEIPFLLGYGDRNSKWGWEVKAGFGLQLVNSYQGYILKRIDEFGSEVEPQKALYRKGQNSAIKAITGTHTLSQNQARHEVVDLEEENPFKSTGVVNLHIATGLVYYHSINTSFVITPSYRRSINSITKEKALFNERIRLVGISFGARMKF